MLIKGCRQHDWRSVCCPRLLSPATALCLGQTETARGRSFHRGGPRKHNMLPDVRGRAETTKPREFGNARKPVWIHFQLVGSTVHVHVRSPTEPHFSGWSVAMEMTATLNFALKNIRGLFLDFLVMQRCAGKKMMGSDKISLKLPQKQCGKKAAAL